jgi:cytochrome P450
MTSLEGVQLVSDLPFLDVESDEFVANSTAMLRDMRNVTWLARTNIGVMTLSYEGSEAILKDTRFKQPGVLTFELQGITSGPAYDAWDNFLLNIPDDQHSRLRRLVSGVFSVKSINNYRGLMASSVRDIAATIPPNQPFDFVDAFADKLPVRVIATLLGVPREDHHLFKEWTHSFGKVGPMNLRQLLPEIDAAALGLFGYVRDLVRARRQLPDPGTDILGKLITVQRESGEGGISDEELVALGAVLMFGGLDTTRYQLSIAMILFMDRPELWRELAEHPELSEHATAEVLRYLPAVPENFRMPTTDIVVNNVLIPKGTYVSISSASGNRDNGCVAEPEQFRIDRETNNNITFGRGPHFCLGQAVARAEIEEALKILPKAMPFIHKEGKPEWTIPRAIGGPITVPMSYSTQ